MEISDIQCISFACFAINIEAILYLIYILANKLNVEDSMSCPQDRKYHLV